MKITFRLLIASLILTATIMAYPLQDEASAPRISMSDFVKKIGTPDMVILDVRSFEGYKGGHIPGAISIPLNELPERWKELPKDKLIVAYCS